MIRKTTIKDVAKEAGVSIGTVSYVINNSAPVSADTQKKIVSAIKKLGYHPSSIAQGMAKRRTNLIGLAVPQNHIGAFSDYMMLDLLRGIADVVTSRKFHLILDFQENEKNNCSYMEMYNSKTIDGMILMSPRRFDRNFEKLIDAQFPFVILNSSIQQPSCCCVDVDNVHCGYLATKHLFELGHRRIGFIAPDDLQYYFSFDRMEGYRRAYLEAGIAIDEDLVQVPPKGKMGAGAFAVNKLLGLAEPPTAIIAGSHCILESALTELKRREIGIGKDLGLIGIDNSPLCTWVKPQIDAVAIPVYEIGKEAAEMVIDQIEKGPSSPRRIILPGVLIKRESAVSV